MPVIEPRIPTSPVVRGLRVGSEPVPDGRSVRAWLERQARSHAERRVVLRHGEHRRDLSLDELGVAIDVEDTLARTEAVGHTGSILRRLRETARARRGEIDVPYAWTLDEGAALGAIERSADALRREPENARLDLAARRKVADVPGERLDAAATIAALRERLPPEGEVALLTQAIEAEVTLQDLEDIDVAKVLSSYETRFQPWKRGRSANVALAASLLNELVIRPAELVSFNERVGPRTLERGFQYAPEILGDELTIGVGGGTCQVSSTLHAAAVYGGMDIVQRKSHTRPSGYIVLGLDATVSYPRVDLAIRNAHRFPVVVHATVPERGLLRVELLGGQAVAKVDYKHGVSRVEQFTRRISVRRWLKNGRIIRHQKGTRGMDVFSYVTVHYLDGRTHAWKYYSGYRPTPEVFWVAPDYQRSALPELPKWAKGVEGELEQDGSDVYPTL